MTPDERDQIVKIAAKRQRSGDLLAWSVDEANNRVEFFVPFDARPEVFPKEVGKVQVMLTWLPRAEEHKPAV
jgi:hypothetical protein